MNEEHLLERKRDNLLKVNIIIIIYSIILFIAAILVMSQYRIEYTLVFYIYFIAIAVCAIMDICFKKVRLLESSNGVLLAGVFIACFGFAMDMIFKQFTLFFFPVVAGGIISIMIYNITILYPELTSEFNKISLADANKYLKSKIKYINILTGRNFMIACLSFAVSISILALYSSYKTEADPILVLSWVDYQIVAFAYSLITLVYVVLSFFIKDRKRFLKSFAALWIATIIILLYGSLIYYHEKVGGIYFMLLFVLSMASLVLYERMNFYSKIIGKSIDEISDFEKMKIYFSNKVEGDKGRLGVIITFMSVLAFFALMSFLIMLLGSAPFSNLRYLILLILMLIVFAVYLFYYIRCKMKLKKDIDEVYKEKVEIFLQEGESNSQI